jgi:DNA-binding transcriptional LysR family regulator
MPKRRVKKRRRDAHRNAVCPELSINDLFEFCELYERRLRKQTWKDAATQMGIPVNSIGILLATIEQGLAIGHRTPDFIRRDLDADNPNRTTAGLFYQGISRIIEDLRRHVEDCRKGEQRVAIEASDNCVLVTLPAVLSRSDYLHRYANVQLDIRRSYWNDFLPGLENGHIDLALAPTVAHNETIIDSTKLYTMPRAIVYNKNHKFICKKSSNLIKLVDLVQETVFVITNRNLPGDFMKSVLPVPANGGRHIYVDSTICMYPYIERDFGIGIGYDQDHTPFTYAKILGFTPLADQGVSPLEYRLYYRRDRELSPAADALKQAIIEYAPEVFKAGYIPHSRP